MAEEILFGTGDLYVLENDIDIETLPTKEEIEQAGFKIGESNGEATLTITPEFVDVRGGARNDLLRSFQTSEDITFNAGIVDYSLNTIKEFVASRFSESASFKKLELGGNFKVPINKLLFVHTKIEDGNRIFMKMHKAQNQAGLEWAFNNEEATTFPFEFRLLKDTEKGNIVEIIEELPSN